MCPEPRRRIGNSATKTSKLSYFVFCGQKHDERAKKTHNNERNRESESEF